MKFSILRLLATGNLKLENTRANLGLQNFREECYQTQCRDEIREVFDSRPIFRFVEKGHYPTEEDVYSASGQTETGRYLIVFFIYKKTAEALPISARDMTLKEKRRYAKR